MTYNFDPDQWYDNELALLQAALRNGTLSDTDYDLAVETLDRRHQAMWERLDGSYRIPADPRPPLTRPES